MCVCSIRKERRIRALQAYTFTRANSATASSPSSSSSSSSTAVWLSPVSRRLLSSSTSDEFKVIKCASALDYVIVNNEPIKLVPIAFRVLFACKQSHYTKSNRSKALSKTADLERIAQNQSSYDCSSPHPFHYSKNIIVSTSKSIKLADIKVHQTSSKT
jgi:hypothetical protein